jgi:DNA-directed RNA polymerase subunit K/omega
VPNVSIEASEGIPAKPGHDREGVNKLTEKKKEKAKEEKEEEVVVIEKTLEQLILDTRYDKYKLIPVASRWAKELRKKEEYRNTPLTEVIGIALQEVLMKKVSIDDIIKLPPIIDTYRKPLKPGERDDRKSR